MSEENKYATLGLRALKRAYKKVAEDAIKNNYLLPFWIDGKVEYIVPTLLIEQTNEDVEEKKT